MANISDLTFDEVNTEKGATVFSFGAGDITMSVTALTGDSYTAVTDGGIVKMILKLQELLALTQTTVNAGAGLPEEELDSFPAPTIGALQADNTVTITATNLYSVPVNFDNVIGINI